MKKHTKQNILSVVIPCFNEEATIKDLIISVLKQNVVGEVLFIDDNSTDNSLEIAMSIRDRRVIILSNTQNEGKGFSVSKGLAAAQMPYVLIQDADLEYNPEEYEDLLRPLIDGDADVVFGSRFLTAKSRRVLFYWHRLGNHLLTTLSNILTNIDLTDMETCYKVMKIDVAKSLEIKEHRFGIEPEITAKVAASKVRVFEVPISYKGRTYEEGKKITWKDGLSAIRCILKYNTPREKRKQLKRYIKLGN
jgi:glycosyltransferase involved in cell wall biosynthesis